MPGILTRNRWSAYTLLRARGERRVAWTPLDRIVETQSRRVRAICEAGAEWSAVRRGLEEVFGRLLGGAIAVDCARVDAVEVEPGGEVRAVISRCEPLG